MSSLNLANNTIEEQEKMRADLAAAGVAYKERLKLPVAAERVIREQPELLRDYFSARLTHYRKLSEQLPDSGDQRYTEMAEAGKK